jgi:NAD(P)-dependent dehydrogenase (short-subunit alcohol dehydrogenase family)
MFELKNKISIVTGAGSGIGKAIAMRFAAQGSFVCLLDRDADAIKKTESEISQKAGKCEAIALDVTKQSDVINAINSIKTKHNSIDILANSAGIAHIGKIENTTEADLDRVYSVNVKGIYNTMLACVSIMKQQKAGVILNLASVASSVGISDRFAYSMSKGAVLMMTMSVAKDYVKEGIRSNCISPARVHTPFVDGFLKANYPGKEAEMFEKLSKTQPIGRMAKPDEIANLALYLCSDEASFITGSDYPIDGGFIKLNN